MSTGDERTIPGEGQVFEVLELWHVPCEGVLTLREDIVGGVLSSLVEDPGEVGTGGGGGVGGEALRRVLPCLRVDVDISLEHRGMT